MADWESGDQQQSHDLDHVDEQLADTEQIDDNQISREQQAFTEQTDDYHISGKDQAHIEQIDDYHISDEQQADTEQIDDNQIADGTSLGDDNLERDDDKNKNTNDEDEDGYHPQEEVGLDGNCEGQGQDDENIPAELDGNDQWENPNEIMGDNSEKMQENQQFEQVDTNTNKASDEEIPSSLQEQQPSIIIDTRESMDGLDIQYYDSSSEILPRLLDIPNINIIRPSCSNFDLAYFSANVDATATVKFVLMPTGQVITLACTLGQTLESLKSHFGTELKISNSMIILMFEGKPIYDNITLSELGVGPNGTIQLEIQSADPVNNPFKAYRPRQEYHMPDVITVRVTTEDCETKDVVVEIERSRTKKPFLGGFRNKNTGMEFHNASAQTMQKPRPPPTTERFCRDTQTCEQRNMLQQTNNNTCTQMTGIRVYISNLQDRLLAPGEYCTADQYWAMILNKVLILQKNFRRWLAKRYVKKLKEDKENRLAWEKLEEMRKKKEKEERLQREYARRINPKTKADFDRLLHCLEKWRMEEMERIESTLTGAERKAAICMLLDQETELLSAIERHKNDANYDNRATRIMNFLEKAAAPKMWQAHDGKLTYMDTPFTIRAKELRDIYNSINMKYLTQDERLDVLLTLKHTVKEHDCKLTQEIIELIDREADLLMRGVKSSNLTGLRKRICTLYLQYIKTPTFNPEAAKYLKVPQDASTLRKNINYCHSCSCYLPSTDFFITTNSRNAGRCRRCQKTENEGRQREDHTYFRVMLRALHKSEEAMQDGSTLCYLLQENDLRYLVENIWSNQSVLSAWNDPYDLVLCRWNKHQEWSPWNCILLTHDEAEAHKKLFSLEEGYGHVFIHKVTQKHNFAKNYFSRLPGMSEALRKNIGSREMTKLERTSVVGHAVGKVQKV